MAERLEDIAARMVASGKGILAADALSRGISTPQTWIPADVEEFKAQAPDIALPAFVKLRESAAGVGIQKVKTLDELTDTFHEFVKHFGLHEGDMPIIQAAVPGDDYCVTTLFDNGRLAACMTYHNLRAFPAEKGAGVMRETVAAPRMEAIAAEVLGPMGWHGVAELDFRWDGDPEHAPHLIEVNPRFWGGLIQAVESGWDYPWLLFQLGAFGKVEADPDGRYDVRTETPILAFLATLQDMADNDARMDALSTAWKGAKNEFREGSKRASVRKLLHGIRESIDMTARLREVKRLLKEHEDNVYDVLSSHDPMPAMGILFPLAVFLRHGKLNMELLTGESGPGSNDD